MSGLDTKEIKKQEVDPRDKETSFFMHLFLDAEMPASPMQGHQFDYVATKLDSFLQKIKKREIKESYILELLSLCSTEQAAASPLATDATATPSSSSPQSSPSSTTASSVVSTSPITTASSPGSTPQSSPSSALDSTADAKESKYPPSHSLANPAPDILPAHEVLSFIDEVNFLKKCADKINEAKQTADLRVCAKDIFERLLKHGHVDFPGGVCAS